MNLFIQREKRLCTGPKGVSFRRSFRVAVISDARVFSFSMRMKDALGAINSDDALSPADRKVSRRRSFEMNYRVHSHCSPPFPSTKINDFARFLLHEGGGERREGRGSSSSSLSLDGIEIETILDILEKNDVIAKYDVMRE